MKIKNRTGDLISKYNELRQNSIQLRKDSRSKGQIGIKKGKQNESSSKYTGVTWHCQKRKWKSSVMYMNKHINLGYFKIEEQAALAYDNKLLELFGHSVKRNFPEMPNEEIKSRFAVIQEERNSLTITEKLSKTNQGILKPKHSIISSQYVGVYWQTNYRKWVAQITYMRQIQCIGHFDNEYDVAVAYDMKAIELFGEEAKLNFPN